MCIRDMNARGETDTCEIYMVCIWIHISQDEGCCSGVAWNNEGCCSGVAAVLGGSNTTYDGERKTSYHGQRSGYLSR
jgi:hypothetical protein